jgi:hypothetical protein
MFAKRHLTLLAGLIALSCSSTRDEAVPGDDLPIVPEGVHVTPLEGGTGVLEVVALTLRRGSSNPELYAALQNVGEMPACSAALSIELFDRAENSLAAGISGLLTQHFYRLTDGSAAIAACIGPGDVSIGAVTDLPAELSIEDVGRIVYRTPYFGLDVVPIEGVQIRRLKSVTDASGTAYRGTLVNGLDASVANPSVTVFPVNRVGRPLAVAIGRDIVEVPPGGSWTFETDRVDTAAADYLAFPAGALEHQR